MKSVFAIFLLSSFLLNSTLPAASLCIFTTGLISEKFVVTSEKFDPGFASRSNELDLQIKRNPSITLLWHITDKNIAQKRNETGTSHFNKTNKGLMNKVISDNSLILISQEFLYAARKGEEIDSLVEAIRNINWNELNKKLVTDGEKKAFWINLYNGFTQVILKSDPGKYRHRNRFFTSKEIEVGDNFFSLDEIEHGILRKSTLKWSLGYLSDLFPPKKVKALRVKTLDYRIHFALNCGAKSCPPIAFYSAQNLDKELDLATKTYLSAEIAYEPEKNLVHLPALMGWFRADFGGKKKMKELLKKLNVIPADSNPRIVFKKYDWNLFLDHYKTDT